MNSRSIIKSDDLEKIRTGHLFDFHDGQGPVQITSVNETTCILISTEEEEEAFFYRTENDDFKCIPVNYGEIINKAFLTITDIETIIFGSTTIIEKERERLERTSQELGAIKHKLIGLKK